MNDLTTVTSQLPAAPEDLAKFILVGRQKLVSVRAEIKAIDKLQLAQGVRDQKRDEARMLAEALLDAEVRIGELFRQMQKASYDRGNQYTGGKVTPEKLSQTAKTDSIKGLGFNKKQVHQFQQLASNPDLVEQVKAEARENDDLPTRTAVLNLAKYKEEKSKAEDAQIDEDCRLSQLLTKALGPLERLPVDPDSIKAMRRGEGPAFEETRQSLRIAINNLTLIQREYEKR